MAAVGHLAVGACLLGARSPVSSALLGLWAGANLATYYLGMVWLGTAAPFPAVQLVGWEVGIRPVVLDRWWRGFILYLVLGSVLQMLIERWRRKRAEAVAFQRHWREMR